MSIEIHPNAEVIIRSVGRMGKSSQMEVTKVGRIADGVSEVVTFKLL